MQIEYKNNKIKKQKSKSFIATPPGATIKEQLETRGMSQKDFAFRMGFSEKHVSHLINGDVQLTQETAYRLEMVLGLPARFWNNLEAIYREKLTKVEAENALEADKIIAKKIPYNEMAKYGWVTMTRNLVEKVINLRKYFEVYNLGLLKETRLSAIVCRRLRESEKADYALLAWAQKAKLEARSIDVSPINLKKLEGLLKIIRNMTMEIPEHFFAKLRKMLSECGIALVVLPHIGGSFLHGASFYDMNKIVMGLTVRGKDADRFWFSLFHELGHVLLGHINKADGIDEEDEKAADAFARNALIPDEEFNTFTDGKDFSRGAIVVFARHVEIEKDIVVGRLQKENYIGFNVFNDMKQQYEIVSG